jgi:hypothetical protein
MGARFAGTFLVFEECPLGQKMGTRLEDEERPQSACDLLWRRHLVTRQAVTSSRRRATGSKAPHRFHDALCRSRTARPQPSAAAK